MNEQILSQLSSVVRNATPLAIAALGETITERAGIVNLSLNGSLILAAMAAFVFSLMTGSVLVGVMVATVIGGLVALVIAFADIVLGQDQFVIGFVLTLLCADLAQVLGIHYTQIPGPHLANAPIPLLAEIPIIGPILFNHDWMVYVSYVLALGCWFWLFQTAPGLAHRAIGERPEAAFARGIQVKRQQLILSLVGGGLVGLAGASYSLSLKPGWTTPPSMDGDGWIALAIVIFGGWHPFRVMLGAYFFAALRSLASALQRSDIGFAVTLLNMMPWLLMIVTLALVNGGFVERLLPVMPRSLRHRVRLFLQNDSPRALGKRFEP